jgi:CheY-like chemotaxis protein
MPHKILIVDDEVDIQLYLEAALEDEGYEVVLLGEDDVFLETVQREQPDLVCLDILMPRRSGLTLFKELQSDPQVREIPVLLISGVSKARELLQKDADVPAEAPSADAPEAGEPSSRGAVEVLEKPIHLPALLEAVQRLLGERETA